MADVAVSAAVGNVSRDGEANGVEDAVHERCEKKSDGYKVIRNRFCRWRSETYQHAGATVGAARQLGTP